MDRKEELLRIIAEAKDRIIGDLYDMYDYQSIPQKRRKDLLKFDPHLDFNDFVAIYATTVFGSAKDGLVFTVDGIYFVDRFLKKFVNYKDILSSDPEKENLWITTKNCDIYTIIIPLEKDTGAKALSQLLYKLKQYAIQNDGKYYCKPSGKVNKKMELTKDEKNKCHGIIHTASVAAGGVGTGLAQIPASDMVAIIPIQVTMVTSLGAVFGIMITEGAAKGILTTIGTSYAGRTISQFLVGWIPLIGNAINATTAAGITEAAGWSAVAHFKQLQLKDSQKGRINGQKEGYVEAGRIYEQKLHEQAEKFISCAKKWDEEKNEYLDLLYEYEQIIFEYELSGGDGDIEAEITLREIKQDYIQLSSLSKTE